MKKSEDIEMSRYKDKNNVGANTADEILEIAGLQGDGDNNYCVRLDNKQADKIIQKLCEHKISGAAYFNKGKSLSRSYGDLYVSRVKDKGYVWVLILYARRGPAECDVHKCGYTVKKGDDVAKSDIIALSASCEKPASNAYFNESQFSSLTYSDCDYTQSVYLSADCAFSADLNLQDLYSLLKTELAATYDPCLLERPSDASIGYQRFHPNFKYAYLKMNDYENALQCWDKGKRKDLNGSYNGDLKMLIEKIQTANTQLLSTVYNHAGRATV